MFEIFDRPFADPADLFLCRSPWPMVSIVCFYLLFVLKLGRQFMENREPYKLRGVLKAYNLGQIVYNSLELAASIWYIVTYKPYDINCLVVMPVDDPRKVFDRILSYLYYLNKYIDLLDTVFIVLRKSYKQISALHLFHHLLMPIAGYYVIRFNGFGGHLIVMGLLNLFVHIIMYSYYYISIHRPQIKENIWWKKYITILQMVQFVIIFVHSVWTLQQTNCGVPRGMIYITLLISAIMFSMFANFFIHSYLPVKKQIAEKKSK